MLESLAGTATVCALTLSAVLAWSGIAKLRAPASTRADFERIGLPRASLLARTVPAAEIAVALALLARPRLGGPAAATLLAAFTLVLVQILRSGRPISCGCFGAEHDTPVTTGDLVRNVGLMAAAATAATLGGLRAPTLPDLVLVTAGALTLATIAHLLRLHHQLGSLFGTQLAGEIGRAKTGEAA